MVKWSAKITVFTGKVTNNRVIIFSIFLFNSSAFVFYTCHRDSTNNRLNNLPFSLGSTGKLKRNIKKESNCPTTHLQMGTTNK